MKVLVSVFECNPLKGSDSFVGWCYVKNMAKYNTVFALTRTENKIDIENYCQSKNINLQNINFIYVNQSEFFTKKLYKLNPYLGFLGSYFVWQRKAYKIVKKINKNINFDICHHISIADFRNAGCLWKLNVPFIFGPVGGGQETPKCFSNYVVGHQKSESFRVFMNRITTMVPSYRKALKKAAIIYSSNDETTNCIKKRMNKKAYEKIVHLTELCIEQKYLDERKNIKKSDKDIIHIIVSGRLIYRKGVQVLLEAVPQIKSKKEFVFDIYGDGDQRTVLEEFVRVNSLEKKVVFHGKIPFEQMQQVYKEGDIYVLPSLRESTGTAVFEALANKLPVVTFNQNGAKYIVENDAGILIKLDNKEQILKDLASALEYLIDNYAIRIKYGECGFNKLQKYYTWDKRVEQMNQVYIKLKKENE